MNYETQNQLNELFLKVANFFKEKYDIDAEIITSDKEYLQEQDERINYVSDMLISETKSSKLSEPIELQMIYTSMYYFQADSKRYLIIHITIRTDYIENESQQSFNRDENLSDDQIEQKAKKAFIKDVRKLYRELKELVQFVKYMKVNNRKLHEIFINDYESNFSECYKIFN